MPSPKSHCENMPKSLETTLEMRKQSQVKIESTSSRIIENILMKEFEVDYTLNGYRNWAKINKDIAYVRKALGN